MLGRGKGMSARLYVEIKMEYQWSGLQNVCRYVGPFADVDLARSYGAQCSKANSKAIVTIVNTYDGYIYSVDTEPLKIIDGILDQINLCWSR